MTRLGRDFRNSPEQEADQTRQDDTDAGSAADATVAEVVPGGVDDASDDGPGGGADGGGPDDGGPDGSGPDGSGPDGSGPDDGGPDDGGPDDGSDDDEDSDAVTESLPVIDPAGERPATGEGMAGRVRSADPDRPAGPQMRERPVSPAGDTAAPPAWVADIFAAAEPAAGPAAAKIAAPKAAPDEQTSLPADRHDTPAEQASTASPAPEVEPAASATEREAPRAEREAEPAAPAADREAPRAVPEVEPAAPAADPAVAAVEADAPGAGPAAASAQTAAGETTASETTASETAADQAEPVTGPEVLLGGSVPAPRSHGRQFALPVAAVLVVAALLGVVQVVSRGDSTATPAPASAAISAQRAPGTGQAGTVQRAQAPGAGSPAVPADPDVPVARQLAFTARTLQGGTFSGASLAGKPAVMWFWAPWCAVCVGEAPGILDAARRFEGKVTFVGMAGRDSEEKMKLFIDETQIGALPQVLDADGELWASFEVSGQPSYAFISRTGKVEIVPGSLTAGQLVAKTAELAGA